MDEKPPAPAPDGWTTLAICVVAAAEAAGLVALIVYKLSR